MKVKVSGIAELKAKLKKEFEATSAKKAVVNKLVSALKAATPVDTGRARDGWHVDAKGNIVNEVEYVTDLNQGSSQQAPTYFIETTVLSEQAVKPNGTIVTQK